MPNAPLHPHVARLDRSTLDVRYRAAAEPQDVHVRVHGTPKHTWEPDYHVRMTNVLRMLERGLGGGALFAPETVSAECTQGDLRGAADPSRGPVFEWVLRVRAVDPRFLTIVVDKMADSWNTLETMMFGSRFEPEPQFYPQWVSIIGELPPDDSAWSATTDTLLGWLRTPEVAFQPFPDVPFPLKEKRGRARGARMKLRVGSTDAALASALSSTMMPIAEFLHAHPDVGFPIPLGNVAATKTGLTVGWDDFEAPADVARGPLLNVLRWFHTRVTPIASAELDLP